MDTYPCPRCGGVADEAGGCRTCGRAHDPLAATLAGLTRSLPSITDADERARVQRQRTQLIDRIGATLARENADAAAGAARAATGGTGTTTGGTGTTTGGTGTTTGGTGTAGSSRAGRGGGGGARVATAAVPPRQRARGETAATAGAAPSGTGAGARETETSAQSARNTLLTLGGVLLGVAAIIVTGLLYTTTQTAWRAVILTAATLLSLGIPLMVRRTLTATAETIAAFGLLMVLLDGFSAYAVDLFGLRRVPVTLFSAITLGAVAAIAAGYRLATQLKAPQFAALVAVQPFCPLLAAYLRFGVVGFGATFTTVAAMNLVSVIVLGRTATMAWPRRLRDLAWVLLAATTVTATILATIGLADASGIAAAARAGAVLVVTAAVAVAAVTVGRELPAVVRQVAAGGAVVAVVAAITRAITLAWPGHTLVALAAVATAVAVGAALSEALVAARRDLGGTRREVTAELGGARVGAMIAAAPAAVVVAIQTARTVVATVRGATRPAVWHADLVGYHQTTHVATWQASVAAVLLAGLVGVAARPGWRVDAAVLGGAVAVLAAPATGALPFWSVPALGAVAATGAALTGIMAGAATGGGATGGGATNRSAASRGATNRGAASRGMTGRGRASVTARSAIAGALYLDALLTSLARPEVTAATCALLGLAAAGIAGLARSRSERLADGAAGATAFAAPVAVASFAWLAGTPAPVVATLAILVTSAGVALAALLGTQRAAAAAAVWGAGAAAIGCVLLAVRLPGAGPIEIGLAALTLVAAVVTIVHPPRVPAAAPALATAALIAALARLLAVLVPGIGLVTTTAIVLAVALASRLIPTRLQAGPRLGGEAVSAVIVAGLGGLALVQTAQLAILAWGERVEVLAPFGAQVPVSLLLVAAAGWVLLGRSPDRPRAGSDGIDASLLVASLAGLSAPAALHLAAWSPVVITGAFAAAAGIAAALTRAEAAREVARRRVVGALVLGLWAVAAAGAHPARIALALAGVVAVGLAVAGIARGSLAAPEVAGAALAAALTAAPGAVAGLALATGTGRAGILAWTLAITGIAAVVLTPLRRLGFTHPLPGYGVGAAALSVAGASLIGGLPGAQLWAAGAALVAVAAASALRPPHAAAIITAASLPSALIAVVASAPVWLLTLFGPFRGLGHIWQGPAPMPSPLGAVKAAATLLILAAVAAGIALVLGGWSLDRAPTRPLTSVVVAAVLPPLAAAVLVAPAAFGVPAVVGWVALGVAVLGGLAATLSPPTLPSATSLLRGSAGFTCALAGLAGIAGSLATREGTIVALAIVFAAAGVAGSFGQDPAARTVAWVVAAASGIALPIVAVVAAGATLALACFGVLGTTGLLVAMSWALDNRPRRRREATLVDGLALAGGATALGLTTGAPSYAAAVLTICGVLVGAAAPRRDRTPTQRRWLVWSALGVELAGGFLFLYLAHVRLAEAYTAPFAALAVLAGALELRARPTLSSWIAYGPALAGGFLPSLTLMLVGQDPWWRWVTLFVAATGTVILGTWRRRRAATVTGAIVVLAVAFVQMVRLIGNGQVAGAILLTVGGIVLVTLGAFAERRRPSR